jgi:hypothetical protein
MPKTLEPRDPNKLIPDVGPCPYGAPMGRRNVVDDENAIVRLFRVRPYDGDYDRGGAYWGLYRSTPLYAAIGEGCMWFCRAKSRAEAKAQLADEYPTIRVRG